MAHADLLRHRRRELGLRQSEVGRLVGVSQQTVARWENGQRPSPRHVRRLADALQVNHDDLAVALYGGADGTTAEDLTRRVDALQVEVAELQERLEEAVALVRRLAGETSLA